jgi:hypothetical protein
MSDLIYWASILLWPAGVAVLGLAVHLSTRGAKSRSSTDPHSGRGASTPAE